MPSSTLIIVFLVLTAAAGGEGWLLLNAHEKIGDLKVVIRDKQAIIDQKEHDAALSAKLDKLQQAVESKLASNVSNARTAINNAQDDNSAAAAALDSVRRSRAIGTGSPSP